MILLGCYLLIVAVSGSILQHYLQFQHYLSNYNKQYENTLIEVYRFTVYLNNLKTIQTLNADQNDNAIYGETPFTDLTNNEIKGLMGLRQTNISFPTNANNQSIHYNLQENIPDIWDWQQQGAISRVKNQGSCGSCWSFSTSGNIESQYYLKYGKLQDLSQQQLIDCDKYNFGCNGGWPYAAMNWLATHGGLQTDNDYPLRSNYSGPCEFNNSKSTVKIQAYTNITQSQTVIKTALYKIGPLSILLDFTGLFHYRSGVANPKWCSTWPNHALVLAGYGVQKEDYWLIKNSWGVKWGINGYFMLKRGANKCGINLWATTAILQ